MNENLNLVEILKDCPKGTKLYSPIYEDVELVDVSQDNVPYPIKTKTNPNSDGMFSTVSFTKDGRIFVEHIGECMLLPSREQRDWSKFKQLVKPKFKVGDKIVYSPVKYMRVPGSYGIISEITNDKYFFTDSSYAFIRNQDSWELILDKKPKFDPNTLKPFEKVLVRDTNEGLWKCTLFSHIIEKGDYAFRYATAGSGYIYCIPYNDDTKNLVGTAEEPPEYYRYWED